MSRFDDSVENNVLDKSIDKTPDFKLLGKRAFPSESKLGQESLNRD
jgi:hypothetical protein